MRSLRKKVRRLEKSTPLPVVAVVTNMSYAYSMANDDDGDDYDVDDYDYDEDDYDDGDDDYDDSTIGW